MIGRSDRNARLTGTTAATIFVLLALEGVTILFIRPLLSVHEFIGMVLVPPVALKLGTTGWRFARFTCATRTSSRPDRRRCCSE